MPTLKTDGQNCNVLLLSLRNEFDLQYIVDNSMVVKKNVGIQILVHLQFLC